MHWLFTLLCVCVSVSVCLCVCVCVRADLFKEEEKIHVWNFLSLHVNWKTLTMAYSNRNLWDGRENGCSYSPRKKSMVQVLEKLNWQIS